MNTNKARKAHVKGGRIVPDEPVELQEGAEVLYEVIEGFLAEFPPEERTRREAMLEDRSARAHAGGELIDNETAKLRLGIRSRR